MFQGRTLEAKKKAHVIWWWFTLGHCIVDGGMSSFLYDISALISYISEPVFFMCMNVQYLLIYFASDVKDKMEKQP